MDLYKTLTNDVHLSAIEHYEEILWVLAPTKLGAQRLPIFDDFATQWHFGGQYLWRGT